MNMKGLITFIGKEILTYYLLRFILDLMHQASNEVNSKCYSGVTSQLNRAGPYREGKLCGFNITTPVSVYRLYTHGSVFILQYDKSFFLKDQTGK